MKKILNLISVLTLIGTALAPVEGCENNKNAVQTKK